MVSREDGRVLILLSNHRADSLPAEMELSDGPFERVEVEVSDDTGIARTFILVTPRGPGRYRLHKAGTVAWLIGSEVDVATLPAAEALSPLCTVVEDFSAGLGAWVNAADSTCKAGAFVAATPTKQTSTIVSQVDGDHTTGSGNAAFTAVNTTAGIDDVDDGNCILESPTFEVAVASDLSVWYFYGQRDIGDDEAGDFFRLELSIDDGATYWPLVTVGDERHVASWTEARAEIPAGSDVRLRVQVSDGASEGDLVEGGIDDLAICPSN